MQSLDKVAENIRNVEALFPNAVTEQKFGGAVRKIIDFDVLRQELSDCIVEGPEERYQFTWPDKRKSILAANAPINKTLRPCREESVNFDTTENLYIEGDNLEVLKLLQETYLGKVKMIYIDPPYNTGNDFVYNDDFKQKAEEYLENSGQYDEDGNQMVQNTESNGRFHTDWLNMMYPRLKLAKDLLADDGVIFISIDDNEVDNLKKISDMIFGENNFVVRIIWKKRSTPPNDKIIGAAHEYALVYAKNVINIKLNLRERTEEQKARYKNPDNHPKGAWVAGDLSGNVKGGRYVDSLNYPITNPNTGEKHYPPHNGNWRFSKEKVELLLKNNEISFGDDGLGRPKLKRFLCDVKSGVTYTSLWDFVPLNTQGSAEMTSLLGNLAIFDNPKPVDFIKELLKTGSSRESFILDFFSGSATTAHAVMQLNAEDGGKRKFIMVQLPELTDEKSEAYKAGYKNICEIGKERIRRAGKKILEEHPDAKDLDIGFRVLKCDSSNMEDVYYTPADYMKKEISLFVDNVKTDRSAEDLLFQCMLELDTPLSSSIEVQEIGGKTVYNVAGGHLMACFDTDVTDEVVTEIAKLQPSYFVLRDSSMADDSVAANFEQIFKTYSPHTERRVL